MIRINLLGSEKKRAGKRASAAPSSSGGGGLMFVLAVLLFAAASAGGVYVMLNQAKDRNIKLQNDLAKAVEENRRLAEVKAKYEASKAKADQFEKRVQVIDKLRAQQSGPMDLLTTVANTVNSTDAVWLETMTDDGKSIDFTGMALSPDAVADLMANLRKSGAFKTVEIKETAQDSQVKELQAFKFELICEKSELLKAQKKSS